MEEKRFRWWKFILIVLLGVIIDLGLHRLVAFIPGVELVQLPDSIIVTTITFYATVVIYVLIVFAILAGLFLLVQKNISGSNLAKGIKFSLVICGIWLIGMYANSLIFDSPPLNEFIMSIVDTIPIVVMILMLSRFCIDIETNHIRSLDTNKRERAIKYLAVVFIAILFLAGRYVIYALIKLDSAYDTKPYGTFFWTLGVGLWVGIGYLLVRDGLKEMKPIKKTWYYSLLFFGINWLLFNMFIPVMFDISVWEMIPRLLVDIVTVGLGIFIFEIIFYRIKAENESQEIIEKEIEVD